MAAYLKIDGGHLKAFRWFKIEQVPRAENVEANSLVRLASRLEDGTLRRMPIEILSEPSTKESANHVMPVNAFPSWVDLIFEYLMEGKIPENKNKARRIKYQATRYTIMSGKLYRRGYAMPYLRCLQPDEAEYVMRQIYEGVCNNHLGKRSLAQKALRQGYYSPTMQKNSAELVQRYDKCQRFAHVPKQPLEPLSPIITTWPFAKWGIDLIEPLPTAQA